VEQNTLFRHAATSAVRVAKLVDQHGIAVSGQGFLVAFQNAIAGYTGAGCEHTQTEGDLVTLVFFSFRLAMDQGVGGRANELIEISLFERFNLKLLGPILDGKGVVNAIRRSSHDRLL